MKQILAIIICVMSSATVLADSAFVYVTGKTVNLRQEPNTTGKILGTANLGDIYPVNDMDGESVIQGDWIQIETLGGDAESPYSLFPYINTKFVKVLNNDEIPLEVLEAGFMFDDGVNFGFLEFQNPENEQIIYSLMVKNREMQESGGNGVIDSQYSTIRFSNGILSNPEPWVDVTGSAVYDSESGLLWFAGYLWEQ